MTDTRFVVTASLEPRVVTVRARDEQAAIGKVAATFATLDPRHFLTYTVEDSPDPDAPSAGIVALQRAGFLPAPNASRTLSSGRDAGVSPRRV